MSGKPPPHVVQTPLPEGMFDDEGVCTICGFPPMFVYTHAEAHEKHPEPFTELTREQWLVGCSANS